VGFYRAKQLKQNFESLGISTISVMERSLARRTKSNQTYPTFFVGYGGIGFQPTPIPARILFWLKETRDDRSKVVCDTNVSLAVKVKYSKVIGRPHCKMYQAGKVALCLVSKFAFRLALVTYSGDRCADHDRFPVMLSALISRNALSKTLW